MKGAADPERDKEKITARKAYAVAWGGLARAGWSEEEASRDAREILAFCLGKDGLRLLLDFDDPLGDEEAARFHDGIRRYADHEPMAYITGKQDFGGLEISVLPGVLIPRHDTLVLVEQAKARLQENKPVRVLELGCGSGAVITALAVARPLLQGLAVDIDPLALRVTEENLKRFGLVSRIHLLHSAWFEGITDTERFTMILSNPPYISTAEMLELEPSVKREPKTALWGGWDGLDAYREILPAAINSLEPGGWCLVEIGWRQGAAVRELFISAGFGQVETYRDEGGRDRVVAGRRI